MGRSSRCALGPPLVSVPEAACTVRVPILLRPRDPAGAVCLRPDGSLLMHRTIQANHLALNVLAVCAVFVFVGAVLLGAF